MYALYYDVNACVVVVAAAAAAVVEIRFIHKINLIHKQSSIVCLCHFDYFGIDTNTNNFTINNNHVYVTHYLRR